MKFIFNPRRELPKVTSRVLRWAIKLITFDFDIIYIKENTTPYIDTLSRLNFDGKRFETSENSEDKILHWVDKLFNGRKNLYRIKT